MGKTRSPNRDKAFEIYKDNKGNIAPRKIADMLGEKPSNISTWKNKDKWDEKLPANKGGAPKGNLNSLKHGLYSDESKRLPEDFIKKYFPSGMKKAYNDSGNIGMTKLEMLGHSIDALWARILVSSKITEVKNKRDMTKELKRTKDAWGKTSQSEEREYEIQFPWDKENNSIDTYSKTLERLSNMIEKYEKLLHANWDLATEEQKLRIEKLKTDLSKGTKKDEPIEIVIKRKSRE